MPTYKDDLSESIASCLGNILALYCRGGYDDLEGSYPQIRMKKICTYCHWWIYRVDFLKNYYPYLRPNASFAYETPQA